MCTVYTQVLEDQYILLPFKKINFSYSITVLQTVMHNWTCEGGGFKDVAKILLACATIIFLLNAWFFLSYKTKQKNLKSYVGLS